MMNWGGEPFKNWQMGKSSISIMRHKDSFLVLPASGVGKKAGNCRTTTIIAEAR